MILEFWGQEDKNSLLIPGKTGGMFDFSFALYKN